MSSLIVQVRTVDRIEKHPDPQVEKLKVVQVDGWQVVTTSDLCVGDKVVYVPPDVVLNEETAIKWGVKPYLKKLPLDQFGNSPGGGRVGIARLRGVVSFGFIAPLDDPNWDVGTDVASYYQITKWEPPPKLSDGDSLPEISSFHGYSSPENIRNFKNVISEGEEVVFTEKIHGTQVRVAIIATQDDVEKSFSFMAGSHKMNRKEFDKNGTKSTYWLPLNENMKHLLQDLSRNESNVVVFGEIFGSSVQDMTYGMSNGKKSFRAFDVAVNGTYLDFDVKKSIFEKYNIEMVPVLYRGPFSPQVLDQYTSGPTTVCDPKVAGKFSGREGVVITPVKERQDIKIGRVILKSISPDYSMRKGETTEHH